MLSRPHTSEPGHSSAGPLTPELHAVGVDLRANAERYSELSWDLSPEQQQEVTRVREHLLGVPVLHAATPGDTGEFEFKDGHRVLLPNAQVDRRAGHTHALDRSLGLDQYVFWVPARPPMEYGSICFVLRTNADFWRQVVVTPRDIVHSLDINDGYSLNRDLDRLFSQLSDEWKDSIRENYLDKMLSGDDWCEIVARRLWSRLREQRESGAPLVVTDWDVSKIGITGPEIKHLGQVDVAGAEVLDDDVLRQTKKLQDEYLGLLGFVRHTAVIGVYRSIKTDYWTESELAAKRQLEAASHIWEDALGWPRATDYDWSRLPNLLG